MVMVIVQPVRTFRTLLVLLPPPHTVKVILPPVKLRSAELTLYATCVCEPALSRSRLTSK